VNPWVAMKEVTRSWSCSRDGEGNWRRQSGAGAREGENHADESEESNKAPRVLSRVPPLRTVHQAKESSGDHNRLEDAGGIWRKADRDSREKRFSSTSGAMNMAMAISNMAPVAALEEFLDGNVVHILDARTGDGDKDARPTPRKEIHHRDPPCRHGPGASGFSSLTCSQKGRPRSTESVTYRKKKYETNQRIWCRRGIAFGFDHWCAIGFSKRLSCRGKQKDAAEWTTSKLPNPSQKDGEMHQDTECAGHREEKAYA